MWVEKGFFILSETVGGLFLCAYCYFLPQLNGIKESSLHLGVQTSLKQANCILSTLHNKYF